MNPQILEEINLEAGLKLELNSLSGITSTFLTLVIPIAGLILFVIIIISGFNILTGANDPKKVDQAKQTLTTAIIGFIVVFAAYWIAQILEVITGFPIVTP